MVPWQAGIRTGIILAHETIRGSAALELREAIATLDTQPFLTEAGLEMLVRLADYSCAPVGLILANFLAVGLNEELEHEIRPLEGIKDIPLPQDHWTVASSLSSQSLDLYRRQGLIKERVRPKVAQVRVLKAARLVDEALEGARQVNQRRALELLWEHEYFASAAALSREADVPESAVRSLINKGYASYEMVEAPPPALPHFYASPLATPQLDLQLDSAGQEIRLSVSGGLRRDRLATIMPLLQEDIRSGESALVLLPENAFIEETAGVLAAELPVQVISGGLTDAQRLHLWTELQEDSPVVLVGSYLALLAPLRHLKHIVVLEEASSSYKMIAGARVFVPTAARFLAEAHGSSLIFADKLPSPEVLSSLAISARAELPNPQMRAHIVDLARVKNWPLSAELIQVLKQVSERSRQAIVIAPRRGFSAAFGCLSCGWLAYCPNCDLPLRYHQERYRLRCHQCGHTESLADFCPECHNATVGPLRAAGTQWIATEISKLLPDMTVKRFDSDKRDDLSDLLAGQPGVLVATTAVLRHPPLPNVSLIAVTLIDTFFNLSDFRAEEEAYRFLLNLAELAPEKRPLVLIQTFRPEHEVLKAFVAGTDPKLFLTDLLKRRERYQYPPFSLMAKVQVSARQASAAQRAATWLAEAMFALGATEIELLGPAPAPVARIRNQYSYQLFLRAANLERLQALLEPARNYRGEARVRIDVDPRDIPGFIE